MSRKLIYENSRPKFAISREKYQWILSRKQSPRGEWTDNTYHLNLVDLLDELAEQQFRRYTKRLNDLRDLDRSVSKTYNLIAKVGQELKESARVS